MIVDHAMYRDGERVVGPRNFSELNAACRGGEGIAWIGLYRPDAKEFEKVAEQFGLHPLAVEDAAEAHQRPKLERARQSRWIRSSEG